MVLSHAAFVSSLKDVYASADSPKNVSSAAGFGTFKRVSTPRTPRKKSQLHIVGTRTAHEMITTEPEARKKVVIVGAGFSGLFTLKHCLAEGFDATLYEASSYIGGVWDERAKAVLPTTECVSSKLYMGASDFPMDESYPEFPMHYDVLRYIHSYAERFQLLPHIKTNCAARSLDKQGDQWHLTLWSGETIRSDFVVLSTGLLGTPTVPEEWKACGAQVLHGGEYAGRRDELSDLQDKKILILGTSDTACDVANDLFNKGARNMYMSSRKGAWFQDKSVGYGRPADMYYNRLFDSVKRWMGRERWEAWILKFFFLDGLAKVWGENGLGVAAWKPSGGYLASAYVKSRKIINLLNNGTVKPVTKALPLDNGQVAFQDEHGAMEQMRFDLVIACTGFKFNPSARIQLHKPEWLSGLYKKTLSHADPSLAVVGNAWRAAHLFAHPDKIPDAKTRAGQMEAEAEEHAREFPTEHDRLPHLVDPYDFTRSVAEDVGVDRWWAKMSWHTLLCSGPRILLGSWSHTAYRLTQRESRETALDNLQATLQHPTSKYVEGGAHQFLLFSVGPVCLALACFRLWK